MQVEFLQNTPLVLTALLLFLTTATGVFYLLYSIYTGQWKRRLPLQCALILLSFVPAVRCYAALLRRQPPAQWTLWAAAVLCAGLLLLQFGLLLYDKRSRKAQITRLSVKESIDCLPVALCFARENGQPVLVNQKMRALSFELQGGALLNANRFWHALESQTVRTGDGEVWAFQRTTLTLEDAPITQIVAIPITDLDRLRAELQQKNEALLQNNRRLRQYGHEAEALTREKEIFSAKSRLHNEIGSLLLATHHALLHPQTMQTETLLEQWSRLVALLRQQQAPDQPQEDLFAQFKNAAASIDVSVHLHGYLPADPALQRLIVAVGKEALTNAVRHANATCLTLQIDDRSDGYTVKYTNDGDPPKGDILPGGGLSSAKTLVERAGGWLAVSADPAFALTFFVPYEGGQLQ